MFDSIAKLVTRRGWLVILVWGLLAGGLYLFAPRFREVSQDDSVRFFPPRYPSVIGQDLLERGFPGNVAVSTFVIVGDRPDRRLSPAELAYLDSVADAFKKLQEQEPELPIKNVTDHRTPIIGTRLLGRSSEGGEAGLISVALTSTFAARKSRVTVDRFEKLLKELPKPPEGLRIHWTGSAAVGHDANSAANESIARTTDATIFLVVVILLLVYRSPVLALIPLATIGLSVFIGLKVVASLVYLPWFKFQVINITQVFVVVVLFGAGTDYCLFLIARYREELARGRDSEAALTEAIKQVGGALVASAGTVVVGLGMLYFSSFDKIRYTGPAIAVCLAIALTSALTLAPVLLSWLRGAVFWPFRPPHHVQGRDPDQERLESAPSSAFWEWVAGYVVTRPGLILSVSLVALIPLAVIGVQTRPNYSQLDDLHENTPSVLGAEVIHHYFPVGELGPSWVLVHHPELDFRSEPGLKAVEAVSARIAQVPNVAEVRSVSRPLGKPLGLDTAAEPAPSSGFLQNMARRIQRDVGTAALRAGADPRYVGINPSDPADYNHITRIEVIYRSDPFSPKSIGTLRQVHEVVREATTQNGPFAGASLVGLSGASAEVNDLETVTTRDERRMYVLVTIGVYLILLLLLRRPGISLYLIATVVLGYLATLGLTEVVFRNLHTGPEPWRGMDWKVGFFLFVILVAVGEDYNILLMARVIEEERKHGPIEGTRRAVAHTGGIISSCGLIMAGTFLSMLTGSLSSLKQLGLALGFGVLLDTFIVRPILVPAFVVLWHRLRPRARLESAIQPVSDTPSAATSAS